MQSEGTRDAWRNQRSQDRRGTREKQSARASHVLDVLTLQARRDDLSLRLAAHTMGRPTLSPIFVGISVLKPLLARRRWESASRSTRIEIEDTRAPEPVLLHDGVADTLVSGVRDDRNVERSGNPHQVGKGGGLHLAHHLASVGLHRYLADTELDCNLLVQ